MPSLNPSRLQRFKDKVVIVGAVNDIALFRELMARGVSEYIVPPIQPLDLIRTVCGLYVNPDKPFAGRVISVIGARGGIGASTIAHNLAWSIAERQESSATLLDLALGVLEDEQHRVRIALLAALLVRVDVFAERRLFGLERPICEDERVLAFEMSLHAREMRPPFGVDRARDRVGKVATII